MRERLAPLHLFLHSSFLYLFFEFSLHTQTWHTHTCSIPVLIPHSISPLHVYSSLHGFICSSFPPPGAMRGVVGSQTTPPCQFWRVERRSGLAMYKVGPPKAFYAWPFLSVSQMQSISLRPQIQSNLQCLLHVHCSNLADALIHSS